MNQKKRALRALQGYIESTVWTSVLLKYGQRYTITVCGNLLTALYHAKSNSRLHEGHAYPFA